MMATFPEPRPLIFGIYPGSATGEEGAAPILSDDPVQIRAALDRLQGFSRQLMVRGYVPFKDSPSDRRSVHETPQEFEQYASESRRLDVVLQFQSASGDVAGWLTFVREQVQRLGPLADAVQVTEEANVPQPGLDGSSPHVQRALVQGVLAAKDEARRAGFDHLQVGFNAAPSFGPAAGFWQAIGEIGGPSFVAEVDHVGLDFFPGVFRPVPGGNLRRAVAGLICEMRETWLPAAGIPDTTPIRITENAWPTGPDRPYERQAEVLETIIRTIGDHRARYHITHYEMHGLRDADSRNPSLFCQFGLLRDDYTPKPAFETYRRLIQELGA